MLNVLETCLYVNDLEAAIQFYGELLEFPQLSYVPERHVFFQAGSSVLLIFLPQITIKDTTLPAHGTTGPGHVAFAVSEATIDDWKQRFTDAGIAIAAEHQWPRGGRSIYVHDPAGNVVELAPPGIWGLEIAEEHL